METIKQKRREGTYFRIAAAAVSDVESASAYWPTVTSVKLSHDRSHLTIYVTFERNSVDGLAALENAKGFVRSQIAHQTSQRIAPQVHFALDTSEEEGRKIEQIINAIKNPNNS